MKKIIFILMLAAPFIYAQPQGKGDGPKSMTEPMMPGDRIVHRLDLTADQEKQFDNLRSDMQKKQIELRSKVQILHLDVKDLFNENTPSKSKIEAKLNEIEKYRTEMRTNHLNFWFDVNKILTPEQQKMWKDQPPMLGEGMGPDWPGSMMRGDMKRTGKHGRGMRQHDCCNFPCR